MLCSQTTSTHTGLITHGRKYRQTARNRMLSAANRQRRNKNLLLDMQDVMMTTMMMAMIGR